MKNMVLGVLLALTILPTLRGAGRAEPLVAFEEVWTIGKQDSRNAGELLGGPQRIAVDGGGLIYVIDHPRSDVRVYNPDGRHLRDIGARGRGPGEFLRPTAIAGLDRGGIVVADGMNNKFVVLTATGQVSFEAPITSGGLVQPTFLGQLDTGFASYFQPPTSTNTRDVLHVFPPQLDQKVASFAEASEIWRDDDRGQAAIAGNPRGARFVIWDGGVCATSYLYDGAIRCYDNHDGSWRASILKGVGVPRSHIVNSNSSGSASKSTWRINGPMGHIELEVLASSRGFASTSEHLIHFSVRKAGRTSRLFVERFNKDGRLLDAGFVSNYPPWTAAEFPVFEVLASTEDGNFLFTDQRNGYPVIHLSRISFE